MRKVQTIMIQSRILTPICGLVLTATLALAQAPAAAPMASFGVSAPDWFNDRVGESMAYAQAASHYGQMAAQYAQAAGQYGKLGPTLNDVYYENGQRLLDGRHWDQALEAFSTVTPHGGSRADGALYWKAYTLNKLGRRDEAMAAIAELRKSYATSRWLDDAKVLEVEVKQAAGQKVSPESEPDDDLKLMAINGLMQSDSERAIPLLENLLKGAQSPKLKERALFVLAQSSVPKAQQLLEQVARGGGNPDLQAKAITYVGVAGRKQGAGNGQLLSEIYASTNDANVKRAILNAYMANRDTEHLLQIAKTEKAPELRLDAIRYLGSAGSPNGDALVAIYGSDQDKQVKQTIVETLFAHGNAKAMVDLARNEKDPELKKTIVRYLSTMRGKEATDYLMEILK